MKAMVLEKPDYIDKSPLFLKELEIP